MQVKDLINQWRDARKQKRGGSGQIIELLYFRNRKEFATDFFCVFILPIDEHIVWIWVKSEGVTWHPVVHLAWNDPYVIQTESESEKQSIFHTYETCPLKLYRISFTNLSVRTLIFSEVTSLVEYLMSICKRAVCKVSDSSRTCATNNTFNVAFWTHKTFQHLLFLEEVVRKHSDTTF